MGLVASRKNSSKNLLAEMLETELHAPIKRYFESKGYAVQAEVKHCDLVATRADELIVIELKTSANMALLVQATARQAISDQVYVAIPQPKKLGSQWRGIKRVIKRLGLGLLVVSNGKLGQQVNCYLEPAGKVRRNKRKRALVEKEIDGRNEIYNIGGSTGVPIITAYKQNAILIACFLERMGEATTHQLRKLGCGKDTTKILYQNHYGWFERMGRATYRLTDEGIAGARQSAQVYTSAVEIVHTSINKMDQI